MIARRVVALALASLATLPAASRDPLEGYSPAGPAMACLSDTNLSPVILDRHTVGLRRGASRWWVSRIADCPALDPLSTLVVERFGGQLCRHDRFRVISPGVSIPSGYCFFARFTPYRRAERR